MRRIAIVLVLMVSGCSYITPPLTNISGPDTQITKKEMVMSAQLAEQGELNEIEMRLALRAHANIWKRFQNGRDGVKDE